MPAPPGVRARPAPNAQGRKGKGGGGGRKPALAVDDRDDPASWLGFSLPPRAPTGGGLSGPPRRSRRNDAWRGSPLTREKFVNASFRFVLKPTESLSYGAHFADPDIALHWPNILQVLMPTFSAYSVAQGFVSEDNLDDDAAGEEAAERRRRIEEEKQGRSCPICLSKPVAGRMTKCGHIFCFPCILHFIQLSEVPKSAACPICGDTIHEGMLKSVRYLDAQTMVKAARGDVEGTSAQSPEFARMISEAKNIDSEPAVASGAHRINMRLLQRPQMTTLALPTTPTWPSDAIPPLTAPWHFLPDVLTYSRFMLATPEYMLSELERELRELDGEWDLLAGDDLGRSFVKAAQDKVKRQMEKVNTELVTDMVRRTEREAREAWADAVGGELLERDRQRERERMAKEREEREAVEREQNKADNVDEAEVPVEFLAASGVTYSGPTVRVPPNISVEPNPMPPPSNKRNKRRPAAATIAPPTPPAPSYHFYQSMLGANVFLNPLDSRMLLAQFHSYAQLPPSLSFPTTGYDAATVTDELRRRVKYLSHLPVGTEVVFVEADLSALVSKDVLAQFEQALKARRVKRRDRTRREDRDKRRYEQAEKAKMPAGVRTVPSAMASGQGANHDHDLALALARSLNMSSSPEDSTFPLPSQSRQQTPTQTAPAPVSTSPTAQGSFAWALRERTMSSNPVRRKENGIAEAWGAFDDFAAEAEAEAEAGPATGGKKKKGAKKGKKLVLGGAGRPI